VTPNVSEQRRVDIAFSNLRGQPNWTLDGAPAFRVPTSRITFDEINIASTPLLPKLNRIHTVEGRGPANSLLTVSSSTGSILTDASGRYVGSQVAVDNGGQFRFQFRPALSDTPPIFTATEVYDATSLNRTETRQTQSRAGDGLLFDMDASSTASTPAFVGAAGEAQYAGTLGYGWTTAVAGFDREPTGRSIYRDLLRDGYWPGTVPADKDFRIDLADGTYEVTVIMGDAGFARDDMSVAVIEGGTGGIGGISTAVGEFAHRTFTTSIQGGHMTLRISDTGGDPLWALNGIAIHSVVTPFTLQGVSSVQPDEDQLHEFTALDVTPGLYTVSTTLGTIVMEDVDDCFAGVQVLVPDSGANAGQLSFKVRAANLAKATISAEHVLGADRGVGNVFLEVPPLVRFDFNAEGENTSPDFIPVRGETLFAAGLGYGWDSAVSEFERSGPTPLLLDGHFSGSPEGNVFQCVVDPGTTYDVRVHVGDADFPRDDIEITVEGATRYVVKSLEAGQFDHRTTTAGITAGDDGILSVTVRDLGGDSYWAINGIEIWNHALVPKSPLVPIRTGTEQ